MQQNGCRWRAPLLTSWLHARYGIHRRLDRNLSPPFPEWISEPTIEGSVGKPRTSQPAVLVWQIVESTRFVTKKPTARNGRLPVYR